MKDEWKLFLDQNIRLEVRDALRNNSVEVIHSSEILLERAHDPDILRYAIENNRTLVTHDYDLAIGKFSHYLRNIPESSGCGSRIRSSR